MCHEQKRKVTFHQTEEDCGGGQSWGTGPLGARVMCFVAAQAGAGVVMKPEHCQLFITTGVLLPTKPWFAERLEAEAVWAEAWLSGLGECAAFLERHM